MKKSNGEDKHTQTLSCKIPHAQTRTYTPVGGGVPPVSVGVVVVVPPPDVEVVQVLGAGVVALAAVLQVVTHVLHRQSDRVALEGGRETHVTVRCWW